MKKIIPLAFVILGTSYGNQASAHVGYRSLENLNPFIASVSGDHGWYDGTQTTLGNSHAVRWFSFTLNQDTNVNVNVDSLGAGAFPNYSSAGVQSTTTPTFTSIGDLDVGFSIYKGLLPSSATGQAAVYENANWDHDSDPNTPNIPTYPAATGNLGLFNALADVTMGNDNGEIGTIEYITHMNNQGSGASESLQNYFLQAGTYSLAVGGTVGDFTPEGFSGIYGIQAQVSAVPVPAAVWFFSSALTALIGFSRRKQLAA